MTSPCRTCYLRDSDKNNSTCLKCSQRVVYVHALGRDLCFGFSRSDNTLTQPPIAYNSNRSSLISIVALDHV
jgi:hypothetical protein